MMAEMTQVTIDIGTPNHYELQQNSTPTFYPRGTGHVLSNLLLSAGILAQYKTHHEEIKTIYVFFKGFCLVES